MEKPCWSARPSSLVRPSLCQSTHQPLLLWAGPRWTPGSTAQRPLLGGSRRDQLVLVRTETRGSCRQQREVAVGRALHHLPTH